MAYSWEDERIQAAGKKWQEANKTGDQNAMNAAAEEARRLRQDVYGYQVDQKGGAPTVTDGSKWTGSNPYRDYQKSRGLGTGSRYADTERNAARQSGGSSPNVYDNAAYSGYDDILSNTRQAYQDMLRMAEERNRLATEQGASRLEANRGTINQSYDDLARQAYIQKMQTQKNLPQMLAGQGLTGGASETARLAIDTSYGNNLYESEQARRNALTALDQSIADLRSTGDLNLIDQQLALQQQGLSDFNNIYAQKIAQDDALRQYQQQDQETQRQRLIEQIPAHYEDYTAYINELQNNGDPSDDWLIPYVQMQKNEKVADMQAAQAAAAQQAFENRMLYDKTQYAINKQSYKTGSGGGNRSGSNESESGKPRLTASQAKSAYDAGIRTDDVVNAMNYWYGTKYGLNPVSSTGTTLSEVSKNLGNMGFHSTIVRRIMQDYESGKITEEKARQLLEGFGLSV